MGQTNTHPQSGVIVSSNRRAFCDKTVSKAAYSMDPFDSPQKTTL